MGGYGSGKKYWRSAKEKVENCRSIDANSFSRWGYFKPGGRGGIMKWTRNGMETGSCWVYSNIDKIDDSISVSYQYQDKPHPEVKVKLSWYSPGFGGRRYFFRCCLLYTSDAADDLLCVDLGCRRIIKKKNNKKNDERK